MHHRTRPARPFGVTAALLIMATALVLVPGAQQAAAVTGVQFARFSGTDRHDTARLTGEATFPGGTQTAILARSEDFPDALAGNYLAGVTRAPILLTRSTFIPGPTRTALGNLKVKNVIILGGTEAVSTAVENELRATTSTHSSGGNLNVTRIAGVDRYDTARVIAVTPTVTPTAVGAPLVTTQTVGRYQGKRTAIVATGDRFPDALVGGPLSYVFQFPILLTPVFPSPTLHAQTRAALQTLEIEHVFVLGGPEAVSTSTELEIRNARGNNTVTTQRLQGDDRTETARAAAEFALTLGFSRTHANLARGDDFPDALTGGPHAGEERTPILLTASSTVLSRSPERGADRYLRDHACTITSGHIYGGLEAVTQEVENQAEAAAGTCAGPQGLPPTTRPELQRVAFVRTVVNDAGTPAIVTDDFEQSTFRFTFDEAVVVAQVNPNPTSPTGAGAAALFHVVRGLPPVATGTVTANIPRHDGQLAAVDPIDPASVLVVVGTKAAPVGTCGAVPGQDPSTCTVATALSVGTVDEGAVLDPQRQPNPIGSAPTAGGPRVECGPGASTAPTGTGGTPGPDLCSVTLRVITTDPITGQPTGVVAIYTFDEVITAATSGRFFLYQSDGTSSACTAATTGTFQIGGVFVPDTGANTATCSTFERFTNAQVRTAVLGSVDEAAVTPGVAVTETNPEGAQPVTGTTGTPVGS